jgi:hypothetical protein
MCRNRLQVIAHALIASIVLSAHADPDPVGRFLSAHAMTDLLEVHLSENIREARSEEDRQAAVSELASFYLRSIREMSPELPERERMLARAWSLSSSYELDSLIELRLELLIERYLPIERVVELHTLLLADAEDTARAKQDLADIEQRLKRIESACQKQLSSLERKARSARSMDSESLADEIAIMRRNLSLTRYYIGWSGYSEATLADRIVPNESIEAFGWLFGAKGQIPTMDDLNHSSLEYEHVARAAIGTALCKARNGDTITARTWLKRIESDESIDSIIRSQALSRRLQVESQAGAWDEALSIIERLHTERDEPLLTPEARFVAIQVLESRARSAITDKDQESTVREALGDLVKRGEIGHILDLQRRYGSLPLLADRFVSRYATALQALSEAEADDAGGRFLTAASLFAEAIKSRDADQFPNELLDCQLKLAYCEINADRPNEAIAVLGPVLEDEPSEPILEQARWLQLVALDLALNDGKLRLEERLDQAVLEYILAYPRSTNAAKLLLRHGAIADIDQSTMIATLLALPDDDPSADAAHRMLVQMYHRQYRDSGRADQAAAISAIEHAEWVWSNAPDQPVDPDDALSRLKVIRMTLDIAMDDIEQNQRLITRAILRGILLVESDASLLAYKDEILHRRIEFLIHAQNLNRAEQELAQMHDPKGVFAQSATRLIFAAALSASQTNPSDLEHARRLVRVGSTLITHILPPAPEEINPNDSAIIASVALAAQRIAETESNPETDALVYRLARVVLERGVPNEQLLRLIANRAQQRGDQELALDAWLRLLAQYTHEESQWHEARYESFRLLLLLDRERAQQAIDQFRVLYPNPGPEPWGTKIQELIGSAPRSDG